MAIQGIVNKHVLLKDIIPHPRNYRSHPDEQISDLGASHERFGQFRSVVLWERPNGQYMQVAGHGIVEAMKRNEVKAVRADVLPLNTPQTDIDAIMVADNNLALKAADDSEILAALLREQSDAGFDLASLGSDEESLRQMLEALGDGYLGNSGQDDEEEDEFEGEPDEEQTRVKIGDAWQLGRHIIACVNSCDIDAVKRLVGDKKIDCVFADPPYGISIVATNGYVGGGEAYNIPFGGVKNRTYGDVGGTASHIRKTGKSYLEEWQEKKNAKGLGSIGGAKPFGSKNVRGSDRASNVVDVGKYAPIVGDDSIETAVASSQLCLELFPKAVQIWWGANYYAHTLPPSSCWIVWDKENTGNFADAELAWCSDKSAVRIFKHMWNGMLKDSEQGIKRVHPSQKPIKLAEFCYERYGQENDVIYDPFLGSGMSLIAAENTNRTVIGCELSPEYIDIIISRWEKHTGKTATLLERVEEVAHV
jgi:DNA modification methylase